MDDSYITVGDNLNNLLDLLAELHESGAVDDYWYFGVKSMIVYRLVKLGEMVKAMTVLDTLEECQWKISMMYFLKSFIYKVGKDVRKDDVTVYGERACSKGILNQYTGATFMATIMDYLWFSKKYGA